ncbi:MAG: class I SAM-dependent rRNA methyltransferase [Verrucomicrobiota bacterium]
MAKTIMVSTEDSGGSETWLKPWVQMKYFSFHPCIFPAMIKRVSPDAQPGSLVHVYDKEGKPFGMGLYNAKARVPLRVFHHSPQPAGEELFKVLLERALDLRLDYLQLPEKTDAFRVINSDGDGLSGLIIDKFNDVLSIEVHSLGIFKRLPEWLSLLHKRLGTKRTLIEVDELVASYERIKPRDIKTDEVRSVRILENGVKYDVNFAEGHKTGFFCDQRENRRKLALMAKDKRVLDLCSYTGGFSISAKLGGATEVIGVDLDEKAIEQAKRNANINNAKVEWVHCDAFSYARQMQRNGQQWDVVILDPPKFMLSREEAHEGERKYEDLNRLGILITKPGGLLVTCSCSGLLMPEHFEAIAAKVAHREGRRLQFIDRTGAGADHPVMSNCPESQYLKLLWARVF